MDFYALLTPDVVLEITTWKDNQDDLGMTFEGRIAKVEGERFFVVPTPNVFVSVHALVNPPVLVGLMFHVQSDLYILYPTLERFEVTEEAKGLWLHIPKTIKMEMSKRRAFIRVKAELDITIMPMMIQTKTIDLSGGGVQFACGRSMPVDQVLYLEIQFRKDEEPLKFMANVVLSRDNALKTGPNDHYAVSCQFMNLTEHQQAMLVAECFKIELGQKRHMLE